MPQQWTKINEESSKNVKNRLDSTYENFLKQREYNKHRLKIVIDMDDLTYGFPAIHFWPKPPITLRD